MITTKCGNKYTNQEWSEMMLEWAKEIAADKDYDEAVYEIKKIAARQLVELAGVAEEKSYGLAHRIFVQGVDGIEFSSPEKEEVVRKLDKWMTDEERKIR